MPDDPQSNPDSTTALTDDIAWLERVLFTQPGTLATAPTWRPSSPDEIRWATLPARGTIRRLAPTSPRFAAEAFANDHDAMSPRRRVLGRIARASVRASALRLAPQVTADAHQVFGDPGSSVIAAAAHALGQPVTSCAITLGPQRYNRKPVVQLIDGNANTVGFLKVGANAATSDMVTTEANAIDQLLRPTDPVLEVPTVLWRSEWNGNAVACFSPVSTAGKTLVPADQARLVAVATAVIQAGGGRSNCALRESAPGERLRTEAVSNARSDIQHLVDRTEQVWGDDVVSVGPWHGDFSSWNMISTHQSTAVIDWEFAGHEMPVGSDLLHHQVMVATHLAGEEAHVPLQRLLDHGQSIPDLRAMSVPSQQHRPHLLLYLFELIRRDLELARLGLTSTGFGEPARHAATVIVTEAENQ